MIDVRCSFPLNILRMNEQDLSKPCGIVHKIFLQSLQFSVTNLSFSFDSATAGLGSDPLTTLVCLVEAKPLSLI